MEILKYPCSELFYHYRWICRFILYDSMKETKYAYGIAYKEASKSLKFHANTLRLANSI